MFKKLLAFLAFFIAATAFAVDVNTASSADLDGVKGIGPALSGRILDERKNGQFKDWDDLIARVKGLGAKSAAKLSGEGLTVNGAPFAGAAEQPAGKTATANEAKREKAPSSPPPAATSK